VVTIPFTHKRYTLRNVKFISLKIGRSTEAKFYFVAKVYKFG